MSQQAMTAERNLGEKKKKKRKKKKEDEENKQQQKDNLGNINKNVSYLTIKRSMIIIALIGSIKSLVLEYIASLVFIITKVEIILHFF